MKKYKPILIIILICSAVFVLLKCFDSYFRLDEDRITVINGSYYTDDQIKALVIKDKADLFTPILYLRRQVIGSIEPIPFVEKIDIEYVDRNSINIYVYDKAVAGCVKHMGSYLHFDREGIVVESSDKKMEGIPEVTGIEFTKVVLNERLEIEDVSLFDKLMNLTQLLIKAEIDCDEINFDLRNNITIYYDGNIALLGSGELHDEQLACLKKLNNASGDVKYKYDLRNYDPSVGEVTGKPIT